MHAHTGKDRENALAGRGAASREHETGRGAATHAATHTCKHTHIDIHARPAGLQGDRTHKYHHGHPLGAQATTHPEQLSVGHDQPPMADARGSS